MLLTFHHTNLIYGTDQHSLYRAIDLIKLNCFVLGDDSSRVFEIKIAPTESVSALKNAFKEERRPLFDHVPADHLNVSDLMPTIGC